jgi:3-deoxy-D-manno-octulosonic-acid transferase
MMLFSATFDLSRGKLLPLVQSLYRKTYSFINTICTISESDKNAIEKFAIHAREIIVAGDTRCDQVIARKETIKEQHEQLLPQGILERISSENLKVIVAGSTWENDEEVIIPIIKKAIAEGEKLFVIIAPHEVHKSRIDSLLSEFGTQAIALSSISNYKDEKIIIVDSIGKLFSFYQNASFAYVGGGFSSGVHNVLESSVWGVPSIVGPNHKRSKEIAAIIGLGGVVEIQNAQEFKEAFAHWFVTDMARNVASLKVKNYVYSSQGATEKIMGKIASLQW